MYISLQMISDSKAFSTRTIFSAVLNPMADTRELASKVACSFDDCFPFPFPLLFPPPFPFLPFTVAPLDCSYVVEVPHIFISAPGKNFSGKLVEPLTSRSIGQLLYHLPN